MERSPKNSAPTGSCVVVAESGTAAQAVHSPAEYDAVTEQARFVAAVDAGLADADAGRVHRSDAVLARVRQRHRPRD